MIKSLKAGWKTTRQHSFIITLLFCYQWVWGLFLSKFIKSTLLPLLHRYPGEALGQVHTQLFWAEAQFRLMKTDLALSWLWIMLALISVRMIITPMINAGLFYSLEHSAMRGYQRFFTGIKQMSKAFYVVYSVQMLITLIPAVWILPKLKLVVTGSITYDALLLQLLPYLCGWIALAATAELGCTYVLFGKVRKQKLRSSLFILLRYLLPIIGIAAFIFIVHSTVSAALSAVSLVWAGFVAIIVHQLYQLVIAMFKIWSVAAQYHFWSSKSE